MLDPTFAALALLASAVAMLAALVRLRQLRAVRQALGDVRATIPIDRVDDPTATDLRAYEVVEEHRKRILWRFTVSTAMGLEVIHELAFALIRDVAAVYHPDGARPELQASVRGLIALNRRVSARLEKALGRFPLSTLAEVRLGTILDTRERYRKVVEHPIARRLSRHRAVTWMAKEAWAAYNVTNPWYWGRRAAFGVGREVAVRRFLVLVATIVGEEAVLLYRRPVAGAEGARPASAEGGRASGLR